MEISRSPRNNGDLFGYVSRSPWKFRGVLGIFRGVYENFAECRLYFVVSMELSWIVDCLCSWKVSKSKMSRNRATGFEKFVKSVNVVWEVC